MMKSASDEHVVANCNTIAKAARALAEDKDTLKALGGEKIVGTGAAMCLNLIAETCHMLVMLNAWDIEIDYFFIEPSLFVLNAIVSSSAYTKTED